MDQQPPTKEPPKPEKPPLSRNQKISRFLIGFLGWYILNGLYWYITEPHGLDGDSTFTGANFYAVLSINLFLFPSNLLALIVLSTIPPTRWVGFGILIALALNLAISIVEGVAFNGWCFIPFFIK